MKSKQLKNKMQKFTGLHSSEIHRKIWVVVSTSFYPDLILVLLSLLILSNDTRC